MKAKYRNCPIDLFILSRFYYITNLNNSKFNSMVNNSEQMCTTGREP